MDLRLDHRSDTGTVGNIFGLFCTLKQYSKYSIICTYFSCATDHSFKDGKTEKMYRCQQEQVNGGEPFGVWRLEGSGEGGPTPEPCYSKL